MRFVILQYDRTSIHAKTAKLYKKSMIVTFPNCIKECSIQKAWVKKSCEIKGGGHEMAAMMLMKINFINAQRPLLSFHNFFTQAF